MVIMKQSKTYCGGNDSRCLQCECEDNDNAPQEVKDAQSQFSIEPLTEDNEESDLGLTLGEVDKRMEFYEGYKHAINVLKKDCDRDRHAEAIVLLETELSYWEE
jgi:hypothetical protein